LIYLETREIPGVSTKYRAGCDGEYVLINDVPVEVEREGELKTRFKDGQFHNQTTLDEIRKLLM
jgi:hypothetical protein